MSETQDKWKYWIGAQTFKKVKVPFFQDIFKDIFQFKIEISLGVCSMNTTLNKTKEFSHLLVITTYF